MLIILIFVQSCLLEYSLIKTNKWINYLSDISQHEHTTKREYTQTYYLTQKAWNAHNVKAWNFNTGIVTW